MLRVLLIAAKVDPSKPGYEKEAGSYLTLQTGLLLADAALKYLATDTYARKETYMLFLDGLIEEIVQYLKAKNWWEETYLVIASDHGYHLGCTASAEMGVKTNNGCCDHAEPWDCEVWDFEKGRSAGIPSNGCRRTTFILSGGALEQNYRGQTIEEAEIIDVIPTIAELLDVPYKCQGKSIL